MDSNSSFKVIELKVWKSYAIFLFKKSLDFLAIITFAWAVQKSYQHTCFNVSVTFFLWSIYNAKSKCSSWNLSENGYFCVKMIEVNSELCLKFIRNLVWMSRAFFLTLILLPTLRVFLPFQDSTLVEATPLMSKVQSFFDMSMYKLEQSRFIFLILINLQKNFLMRATW